MQKFYSFSLLSNNYLNNILICEAKFFKNHLDFLELCIKTDLKEGIKYTDSFLNLSRRCIQDQLGLEFTILFLNVGQDLRSYVLKEEHIDSSWKDFKNLHGASYSYCSDVLYKEIKYYFSLGLIVEEYLYILKIRKNITRCSILALDLSLNNK